jgi:hypothetical protein
MPKIWISDIGKQFNPTSDITSDTAVFSPISEIPISCSIQRSSQISDWVPSSACTQILLYRPSLRSPAPQLGCSWSRHRSKQPPPPPPQQCRVEQDTRQPEISLHYWVEIDGHRSPQFISILTGVVEALKKLLQTAPPFPPWRGGLNIHRCRLGRRERADGEYVCISKKNIKRAGDNW